jgi:acyl-CoA synthetase (NDP forming)
VNGFCSGVDLKKIPSAEDKNAGLRYLLEPASVALIGASDDPTRIGGRPLRYMLGEGFAGTIYPVNPNRDVVQGLKVYSSILDTPESVDCAIIAVPAKIVAQTLEDCASMGVKSAIVFSSGFAEIGGPDGEAMQAQLSGISERTGIRILGPNCLGVLSFKSRFFATFSSSGDGGYPKPGSLAIISQSGAYGTHLYAVARDWGLGVSHVITTGNECDVDVAECIGWAAEADEIKVIAAYAEGIKNGPALLKSLELARANNKPVIFMKVGRSKEGAAAAASHTASLAGADEIYDAVFSQYGVYRADTTEKMLDIAYACTAGVFPTGKRIGLVTISGGVGVQMADYSNKMGLDVAPMPKEAQAYLKKKLPFASALNPVDTTAQFFNDISLVGDNFTIMLEQGRYDIVVAFFTMAANSPYVIEPLLKELDAIRKAFPDRLIMLSLLGSPETVTRYRNAGFLTFEDPCRAIAAAAALVEFGVSFEGVGISASDDAVDARRLKDLPNQALSEWESRELLAHAGISVVEGKLVNSADEAAEAAAALGCPVVMKINGADISHKTEIGGVELNVAAPDEARRLYDELLSRVNKNAPNTKPSGVIVAPMISGGVETILGIQVDPVFGPAIMFGLGGVFVEVFQDVVFRLAPFSRDEAMKMILGIKGGKLLQGVRGGPPSDIDALADALVALSQFADGHADTLASVDVNPFVVLPKGQGAVALDCLVVPKDADAG